MEHKDPESVAVIYGDPYDWEKSGVHRRHRCFAGTEMFRAPSVDKHFGGFEEFKLLIAKVYSRGGPMLWNEIKQDKELLEFLEI
jgi:hypothetical protein